MESVEVRARIFPGPRELHAVRASWYVSGHPGVLGTDRTHAARHRDVTQEIETAQDQ